MKKSIVAKMPRSKRAIITRYLVISAMAVVSIAGCFGATGWAIELAPYEPAEGCYIGSYIELDKNLNGDIQTFSDIVGKHHATYFRYVGYGQPFPFSWVKHLKSFAAVAHIAWEPNDGLQVVKDNAYLRGWAEAARHAGVPIFLRYASEMNGTWQVYSGDPDEYIRKWRLVYRTIKRVAPNVVMVWCPFATPQNNITRYYPGDEYVDWVGVNIYSVIHQDGDINKGPTEAPVALLSYVYNLYADRKPIAICEYGATHYCAASQEDVTDFAIEKMSRLYRAVVQQFPRVRMINWFSVDTIGDALGDNDYSLTSNRRVLDTYRSLIADSHFLSCVLDSGLATGIYASGEGQTYQSSVSIQVPPRGETTYPLAATSLDDYDTEEIRVASLGAKPHRVSGVVEIAVELPWEVKRGSVAIYIDDEFRCITNVVPYRYTWNTQHYTAGEHIIRIEATDRYNHVIGRKQVCAIVVEEYN